MYRFQIGSSKKKKFQASIRKSSIRQIIQSFGGGGSFIVNKIKKISQSNTAVD